MNENGSWHVRSVAEVLEEMGVDAARGLSPEQITAAREKFGLNRMEARGKKSPLVLFLEQFNQPLVYILLAAAGGTAVLREWVDVGVILGVVVVNAITGFVQEIRAVKAIDALSKSMASLTSVIRGGEKQQIPVEELVPGDIVVLQSGDKVPADLRLVDVRSLQADEAALTGESVPVEKDAGAELELKTALGDRSNMAFSLSLVTYGTGKGVVVATGDDTEIGHINQLIGQADVLKTPLTRKIHHLSNLLLIAIIVLASVTFVVGWLRGEPLRDMFMQAVALAVGAVPEGLPAVITITLAIGVSKLAARHAIIRKLPAVETLGSTTVICSDKTGTLTQNQMTVRTLFAAGEELSVSGVGYDPSGSFELHGSPFEPESSPLVMELLSNGLLCNDSLLRQNEDGWYTEGDPTEGALIAVANKAGLTRDALEDRSPRIDVIPFESEYKYMATLHRHGDANRVYMKGSLEGILGRCGDQYDRSMTRAPLDTRAIHEQAESLAARGLRVLAFASREVPADKETINHADLESGLTFLGLQAMVDPPRLEAIEAVRHCQEAGIKVKMITGDHVITAGTIAGELGFEETRRSGARVAIDGLALAEVADGELPATADELAVFARVTPEQKFSLVKSLQGRNHIVAMTGDGVNDAPALQQADIGVAMGITGTEVSKEAADMVLTDDNFASIVAAVEEGRGIFDNLIKFIIWTLPTNLSEGLVILIAALTALQLPISPLQILWINMTTALLLGMMLAFEKKEPGIMSRPPRDPKAPMISGHMAFRILWVGALIVAGVYGVYHVVIGRWPHEVWALAPGEVLLKEQLHLQAETAAANTIVFAEMFYLFNCRSLVHSPFKVGFFANAWIWAGVAAMTGLQFLFTYVPLLQTLFHTKPFDPFVWWIIIAVASLIAVTVEVEKVVFRKLHPAP